MRIPISVVKRSVPIPVHHTDAHDPQNVLQMLQERKAIANDVNSFDSFDAAMNISSFDEWLDEINPQIEAETPLPSP